MSIFPFVVRGVQALFGAIQLGVAAGGTTHISSAALNYSVFVAAWLLLVLLFVVVVSFWQSFNFPVVIFFLEGFTLLFLIIGAIVLPVTLFNNSGSTSHDFCRLILNNQAQGDAALIASAKTGCQCALAALIFDVFSCLLWIMSFVMVIVAWRRTK